MEEDELNGVDPTEVESIKRFPILTGAKATLELEESIAAQNRRRTLPEAFLMKPLATFPALKHLLVPIAGLAAVTITLFVVALMRRIPDEVVKVVRKRLSRVQHALLRRRRRNGIPL